MSDTRGAELPAPAAAVHRRAVRSRRADLLLRLAGWGSGAAAAVAAAALVVQTAADERDTAQAVAALARQIEPLRDASQQTNRELRRLAAAVATLDHDRDRLYARVTALEQADVVTGSIAKAASSIVKSDRAPAPSDTATSPPAPPAAAAPPQPVTPDPWMAAADQARPAAGPVIHTQFGIELGESATVNGLRRLWAATLKVRHAEIAALQPALAVRERPGGIRFRLLAGPLRDAADAARLCAALNAAKRSCAPVVFDGQRLELSEARPAGRPGLPPPRQPDR